MHAKSSSTKNPTSQKEVWPIAMVGAINLIDWLLPPTCPHCPGVDANSLHKLTFCHASALDDGYFERLQDKSLKPLWGL